MAGAAAVDVKITVVDEMTLKLDWIRFQAWELEAARQGSGLTKEQMLGARILFDWLAEDAVRRRPSVDQEAIDRRLDEIHAGEPEGYHNPQDAVDGGHGER